MCYRLYRYNIHGVARNEGGTNVKCKYMKAVSSGSGNSGMRRGVRKELVFVGGRYAFEVSCNGNVP